MDGGTADERSCQTPGHADEEEAQDPAEYRRGGCIGDRVFGGGGHGGRLCRKQRVSGTIRFAIKGNQLLKVLYKSIVWFQGDF